MISSILIKLILLSLLIFVCNSSFQNAYKVVFTSKNHTHLILKLENQDSQNFYIREDNPIIKKLELTVIYQRIDELRLVIRDQTNQRWEIPERFPFAHDPPNLQITEKEIPIYNVSIKESPFSFKITRLSTNETIFDTVNSNFLFSDRYIQFGSYLPSNNIFGFGERVHNFKLRIPGIYTIWNRDLPSVLDEGNGGENTYGLHPVYLMREKSGLHHLMYLRNSNGMDAILNITKTQFGGLFSVPTITYKITGGIIDLKFFLGTSSVENLVKSYHKYVGGYILQPFWSFGYHQSRWGFKNVDQLENLVKKFDEAGMPLDALWMDVDYMIEHNIFTIDEDRFETNRIEEIIQKKYKKKLVLIIDPGVGINSNEPYNEGIKRDIFIKDGRDKPLLACVWPGQTHFPDFFNPKTQDYWSDMFALLLQKVKFSGIWLDMNELSNFVDGEVDKGECGKGGFPGVSTPEKCNYESPQYYYIYNPGNKKLDSKTICLNGKHYNNLTEYNVHNLNGFLESIATYNYLQDRVKDPQPFILSRSTIPGSGKFVMHWTGDNVSTFRWMKLSIAGIFNFNIFGIPNVGADICGFGGYTTEELCSRWMQLGTLYPFARNHNSINSFDQDPFSLGMKLQRTSMEAIKFRYSILKFYYYLFVRNKGVGTVFKPLFFNFPETDNINDNVLDEEFMIGDELLVTPVLEMETITIQPYFPGIDTNWFEIHSGDTFLGGKKHIIINELGNTAPVFLRSGYSIFRQNVSHVKSTDDLDNNFYFAVGLKKENNNRFHSLGQIMGCNNYSDYVSLKKCIDGDCLINVDFSLLIDEKKGLKSLTISFIADSNVIVDEVFVSEVHLYGLENNKIDEIKQIRSLNNENQILTNDLKAKIKNHKNIKIIQFDNQLVVNKNIQYSISF